MIAVHFDRDFAQKVQAAIKDGTPIPPPAGGQWSQNDVVALAGILYAAAWLGGPQASYCAASTAKISRGEQSEVNEEAWTQDIHDAIDFLAMLAFKVFDEQYDQEYERRVGAAISRKDTGAKVLRPIEGFKNLPPNYTCAAGVGPDLRCGPGRPRGIGLGGRSSANSGATAAQPLTPNNGTSSTIDGSAPPYDVLIARNKLHDGLD